VCVCVCIYIYIHNTYIQIFEYTACAQVEHVNLLSDNETGQLKGVGFVTMSTLDEAAKACESINGPHPTHPGLWAGGSHLALI